LAVQGLTPESLEGRLSALPQPPRRAALIAPDHFVLTGGEALLKGLHALLSKVGRGVKVTPVEPGWQWPHPSLAAVGEATAEEMASFAVDPAPLVLQGSAEAEAGRGPQEWRSRARAHSVEPLDWPAACRRLKALGMDTAVEIGHGSALGQALRHADNGIRVLATGDIPSFAQAVKLSN
jgi:malonyl CoA-acyl carrier protein transacylase